MLRILKILVRIPSIILHVRVVLLQVAEDEHYMEICESPYFRWMTKPRTNKYIHVSPLFFSSLVLVMQILFYGEKDDPFDGYPGAFALTNLTSIAHFFSAVAFVTFFFVFDAPLQVTVELFALDKAALESNDRIREHRKRPDYELRNFYTSFECWYHAGYLFVSFISVTAPLTNPGTCQPWELQALLLCHYLRRNSARAVMLSVQKGGPLLVKTAKVK